jgi:hypothetical protein
VSSATAVIRAVRHAGCCLPSTLRGHKDERSGEWSTSHDERGSVLILAIVYLVAVAMMITALAGWTVNDLNNTTNFSSSRSTQYAASGATNLAIQTMRYAPLLSAGQTLNASPPAPCWGNGTKSDLTTNNVDVAVWCSTAWSPTNLLATRVVTFSACPYNVNISDLQNATTCAATPFLQVVVTFGDYPAISTATTTLCHTFCGTFMTQNSWVWSPSIPVVTGVTPNGNALITGDSSFTPTTITGSGFVNVTSVNFVDATPSDNTIRVAPSFTVINSTTISALYPSVMTGSAYYVSVTTSGGTSAFGPASSGTSFTYAPPGQPAVSAISPTTTPLASGTLVTITGSGFFTGATVTFVQELAGIAVGPQLAAAPGSLVSPTSITASTPTMTPGAQYFVTVMTSGGTSAYNSNDVFTYSPQVSTIINITPNSGPKAGGTGLTINGTGFTTPTTVNVVEVSNPAVTFPATGVTVTGPTTIQATMPAVTVAGGYYVVVTTPGGNSAETASTIFTYS